MTHIYRLPLLTALCSLAWPLSTALAQTSQTIQHVVEPVETLKTVKRAAHQTPSGFPVPRYVSLKVGIVNGRIGPSRKHTIAWQYQRKGLPLLVIAETDMWRKVRDVNGDESWIHKPALSGQRMAIALQDTMLYKRPQDDISSVTLTAVALTEKDALLKLMECQDTGWCQFRAQNGVKGWAPYTYFWGAAPLE